MPPLNLVQERLRSKDFKDIENWDVSNVTNMNGLFFDECFSTFNEDISNWDVSNVTNMSWMLSS
jgi:surface protein